MVGTSLNRLAWRTSFGAWRPVYPEMFHLTVSGMTICCSVYFHGPEQFLTQFCAQTGFMLFVRFMPEQTNIIEISLR